LEADHILVVLAQYQRWYHLMSIETLEDCIGQMRQYEFHLH
jgi:hypothetical protein